MTSNWVTEQGFGSRGFITLAFYSGQTARPTVDGERNHKLSFYVVCLLLSNKI